MFTTVKLILLTVAFATTLLTDVKIMSITNMNSGPVSTRDYGLVTLVLTIFIGLHTISISLAILSGVFHKMSMLTNFWLKICVISFLSTTSILVDILLFSCDYEVYTRDHSRSDMSYFIDPNSLIVLIVCVSVTKIVFFGFYLCDFLSGVTKVKEHITSP